MREYLLIAALAAGVLGSSMGTPVAEESAVIELAAPRPAGRGESVELQITTGPLARGARLTLSTQDGQSLGAVTPYPPGRQSNTATVPVPPSAIVDGRLGCACRCCSRARCRARPGPARCNVSTLSWRLAASDFQTQRTARRGIATPVSTQPVRVGMTRMAR